MNIEEVKAQEVGEDSGFFMLLYGKAGVGKSSLSSKLGQNVLVLDCEGTASLIEGIFRIPVSTYEEVVDYKKQFVASEKYDTLVIDGLRSFEVMVEEYVCKVMGRAEFSAANAKFGDLYLKKRLIFTKFLETLIGRGKNVVIISHVAETEKVDEANDESFMFYEPNLKDKELKNTLPALSDLVGYLGVEVKDGKSFRRLDLLPSQNKVCKNRFNIKEVIIGESPEEIYGKLNDAIVKFYKK